MARLPTRNLKISEALYRTTRAWCDREQVGMDALVESLLEVAMQTARDEGLFAAAPAAARLRVVGGRDAS